MKLPGWPWGREKRKPDHGDEEEKPDHAEEEEKRDHAETTTETEEDSEMAAPVGFKKPRDEPDHPDWAELDRLTAIELAKEPEIELKLPTKLACNHGHRYLDLLRFKREAKGGMFKRAYCVPCARRQAKASAARSAERRRRIKAGEPTSRASAKRTSAGVPVVEPPKPDPAPVVGKEQQSRAWAGTEEPKPDLPPEEPKVLVVRADAVNQLSDQRALIDLLEETILSTRRADFLDQAVAKRIVELKRAARDLQLQVEQNAELQARWGAFLARDPSQSMRQVEELLEADMELVSGPEADGVTDPTAGPSLVEANQWNAIEDMKPDYGKMPQALQCPNGHNYAETITWVSSGDIRCGECRKDGLRVRAEQMRARKRQKAAARR